MDINTLLNRIVIDDEIMMGQPIIKGTRITVQHIFNLLAQGIPKKEILEDYQLKEDDLLACYAYVSKNLEDSTYIPMSR